MPLEWIAVGAMAAKIYYIIAVALFLILLLVLKYKKEYAQILSKLHAIECKIEDKSCAKQLDEITDKIKKHDKRFFDQSQYILTLIHSVLGRRAPGEAPVFARRKIDAYDDDIRPIISNDLDGASPNEYKEL